MTGMKICPVQIFSSRQRKIFSNEISQNELHIDIK